MTTIYQIQNVIKSIKEDPSSRRHIVSAWNVDDIEYMALPPCHCLFQFFVENGKLSCQLYQRSADLVAGVPFNIASYALLTHLIARECGLKVGEFVHTFGDAHVYHDQVDAAKEQLQRVPYPFPNINIKENTKVLDASIDDIQLINYQHHPRIYVPVSK